MKTILFPLILLLIGFCFIPSAGANPSAYQVIQLNTGSRPFRILPDNSSSAFWVVDFGNGLICASEVNGQWNIQYYPIYGADEATGPDSTGKLYVTTRCNIPQLVVFDTISQDSC